MKKILKNKTLMLLVDLLTCPCTFISSLWLRLVRKAIVYMPVSDAIFMRTGILPVPDHYYEPLINPKKHLSRPLTSDRSLPGMDFNTKEQLYLLDKFNYNAELLSFPMEKPASDISFYYNNDTFGTGDSEYLYCMVRHFKPGRILEIGSGRSTLMVRNALRANQREAPDHRCKHICIEPYEMPWLEKTGAEIIRKKLEDLDLSIFKTLGKNDILFIDSSHIIRPQGDVLVEYLEILPLLNPGVIVHIHDIFSPKDYPATWIYKEHKLWNEQYLLEAFLAFNKNFVLIGALSYLWHQHREELLQKCPILVKQVDQRGPGPGSFWMIRQ